MRAVASPALTQQVKKSAGSDAADALYTQLAQSKIWPLLVASTLPHDGRKACRHAARNSQAHQQPWCGACMHACISESAVSTASSPCSSSHHWAASLPWQGCRQSHSGTCRRCSCCLLATCCRTCQPARRAAHAQSERGSLRCASCRSACTNSAPTTQHVASLGGYALPMDGSYSVSLGQLNGVLGLSMGRVSSHVPCCGAQGASDSRELGIGGSATQHAHALLLWLTLQQLLVLGGTVSALEGSNW